MEDENYPYKVMLYDRVTGEILVEGYRCGEFMDEDMWYLLEDTTSPNYGRYEVILGIAPGSVRIHMPKRK